MSESALPTVPELPAIPEISPARQRALWKQRIRRDRHIRYFLTAALSTLLLLVIYNS